MTFAKTRIDQLTNYYMASMSAKTDVLNNGARHLNLVDAQRMVEAYREWRNDTSRWLQNQINAIGYCEDNPHVEHTFCPYGGITFTHDDDRAHFVLSVPGAF